MKHYKVLVSGMILAFAVLVSPFASAQSSGNFTATISTAQCTVNTASGALSGGSPNMTVLDTFIKTPNSTFTTLLITPSLVTGLFNNTEVTAAMESSANSAAVEVFVTLDGQPVAPATSSTPGVIYDERFQQLSSNVFNALTSCGTNPCNIDLVESSLAAHSFNFVAPNVGGGTHHLQVQWQFKCTDNSGTTVPCSMAYTTNTAGACAGPGDVTVTQVKTFTQSSGVVIQ
jgi:hypothetical protein